MGATQNAIKIKKQPGDEPKSAEKKFAVPKADPRNRVPPERILRKWHSHFTFGEHRTRTTRIFQTLFALRVGKLSYRTEIEWLIAALSSTAIGNKTSKHCFYDLKNAGIIKADLFWFKELDFKTELTFCRLTEDGKDF